MADGCRASGARSSVGSADAEPLKTHRRCSLAGAVTVFGASSHLRCRFAAAGLPHAARCAPAWSGPGSLQQSNVKRQHASCALDARCRAPYPGPCAGVANTSPEQLRSGGCLHILHDALCSPALAQQQPMRHQVRLGPQPACLLSAARWLAVQSSVCADHTESKLAASPAHPVKHVLPEQPVVHAQQLLWPDAAARRTLLTLLVVTVAPGLHTSCTCCQTPSCPSPEGWCLTGSGGAVGHPAEQPSHGWGAAAHGCLWSILGACPGRHLRPAAGALAALAQLDSSWPSMSRRGPKCGVCRSLSSHQAAPAEGLV